MSNYSKWLLEQAGRVSVMSTPVPSPCLSVCRMDADNEFCQACLRSLDEIGRWSHSDDPGKKAIWALIAQRATQAPPQWTPAP